MSLRGPAYCRRISNAVYVHPCRSSVHRHGDTVCQLSFPCTFPSGRLCRDGRRMLSSIKYPEQYTWHWKFFPIDRGALSVIIPSGMPYSLIQVRKRIFGTWVAVVIFVGIALVNFEYLLVISTMKLPISVLESGPSLSVAMDSTGPSNGSSCSSHRCVAWSWCLPQAIHFSTWVLISLAIWTSKTAFSSCRTYDFLQGVQSISRRVHGTVWPVKMTPV